MITQTMAGMQLGPYRIEALVGRGGMGVVYRAHHAGLDRRVALKVLAPELSQNPSFRERFVRESRVAASVDHPNVIPIYEADEVDDTYFIAMRYVDGMDLKELLREESLGMLDIRRTLTFVSQVAGALDAAHEHGLVHRDVKPGNILVAAGSEHCYLTDFGLTKAASSDTGFTATGHFVGTTDYCAPEQIEGKPIDRRTDVYSLGCVLYECLTGRLPFVRDNAMAIMYAHINDAPPNVSTARSDLPPALDQVIANAMAKDPNYRYPTCSALAADARAALEVSTGRVLPAVPMPSGAFTRPETETPSYAIPHAQQNGATYSNGAAHAGGAPPYDPAVWAATAAGAHGPPDPRGGSGRAMTLVAVIVAALVLAAGGTAAALIVSKRDGGSEQPPASAAAQPAPTTAPPDDPPPAQPGPDVTETPDDTTQAEPPVDTGADEAAAEAAVETHWDAIENHDFSTAFAMFTTPYSNEVSESGWISDHEDQQIESVDYSIASVSVDGSAATVTMNTVETEDVHGYNCFSGSYSMKKVGGEWRISDPGLSRC